MNNLRELLFWEMQLAQMIRKENPDKLLYDKNILDLLRNNATRNFTDEQGVYCRKCLKIVLPANLAFNGLGYSCPYCQCRF